jgi:molybdate transport system substrate-binding protein
MLLAVLALAGCGPGGGASGSGEAPAAAGGRAAAGAVTLHVAAASSLRDVLEDAAPLFTARHGGAPPVFSFDASSTLALQIGEGAAFDVFLSADETSVDRVAARVVPGTRRAFLSNRLALAGRAGLSPAPADPAALVEQAAFAGTTVAWAGPAVPAGRYAREWLGAHGLLAPLEARAVNADSVRAALALLQAGAVDCAFVYRTDALVAQDAGVSLLWTAPAADEPRILFVAAALARAEGDAELAARAWLDWLGGQEFLALAERAGFLPPPARS